MHLLVDADIVAYRTAAVAENATAAIAVELADQSMRSLCQEFSTEELTGYITGRDSFRRALYPEYKANRKDKPKPRFLQDVFSYLQDHWNCRVVDVIEADDALGIAACTTHKDNSIVVSIDKDLLQIPGKHWNWVKVKLTEVTPEQGEAFFYEQLLMGDKADNIPGFDGILRSKPTRELLWHFDHMRNMSAWEKYNHIVETYGDDADRVNLHAQLLYIQQEPEDKWTPPLKQEAVQEQ